MKTLIIVIVLVLVHAFSTMAFAQTQVPVISTTTFPFGGFTYGIDMDSIGPAGSASRVTWGAKQDLIKVFQSAGLNTYWSNGNEEPLEPKLFSLMPSGMEGYYGLDHFYSDRSTLARWISDLRTPDPPGVESRYFLASNWMNAISPMDRLTELPVDADRYSWNQQDPAFKVNSNNGGLVLSGEHEWKVRSVGQNPNDGGQILELDNFSLAGGIPQQLNTLWGIVSSTGASRADIDPITGAPNSAQIVCDFIYRLPPDDYSIAGTLYTVTATWYPDATVNGTTGVVSPSGTAIGTVTANITWADFNAYTMPLATTTAFIASHPNESNNILLFPKKVPTQRYAVLRVASPGHIGVPADVAKFVKFTAVAQDGRADMYIRGFRLRSIFMDNLENHLHDRQSVPGSIPLYKVGTNNYYLEDVCSQIVQSMNRDGTWNAWNAINYVTCGGEMGNPGAFRALAYIDNAFGNYTYKLNQAGMSLHHRQHILTYLAQTSQNAFYVPNKPDNTVVHYENMPMYAWYRSTYEDETLQQPVAIMEEGGLTFGGQSWDHPSKFGPDPGMIPFPGDATYNALTKDPNFRSFTTPITGLPDETGHLWQHYNPAHNATATNTPGYDTYEMDWLAHYQYWNKSDFQPSADAANPANSLVSDHAKWYAFVPTNSSIGGPLDLRGSYLQHGLLGTTATLAMEKIFAARKAGKLILASSPDHWTNSDEHFLDIFPPEPTQHTQNLAAHPGDDAWAKWDHVYPFQSGRTQTATEARMYAWTALSYGAKGIFFNTIGNDGGGNIGCTNQFLQTNYNYDLDKSQTPFLALGGTPVPSSATCDHTLDKGPNESFGYTDHLVYRTQTGSMRWVPIIDCFTTKFIIAAGVEDGTHELIKTYINGLGSYTGSGSKYGTKDYYMDPITAGAVATDWVKFSSGLWCQDNDAWVGYWHTWDNDGTFPTVLAQNYLSAKTDWNRQTTGQTVWNSLTGYSPSPLWATPNQVTWYDDLIIPCNIRNIQARPVAYQGFKEKWSAVTTIGKDLAPIATILSQLDWKSSIDFNSLYTTGGAPWEVAKAMSPVDLDHIISYKCLTVGPGCLRPYSYGERAVEYNTTGGVTKTDPELSQSVSLSGVAYLADQDDRRFYQIGYFSNPNPTKRNDPSPITRVIVVNPRTWPVMYDYNGVISPIDSTDHSHFLLQDIDARMFAFKVRSDIVLKNFKGFSVLVYNISAGITLLPDANGYYQVVLDPGQGNLLAIEPYLATDLSGDHTGKGVANPSNNGRHLTSSEIGPNVSSYYSTFASNGLFVAAPKDTIIGVYRRVDGIPADSLIDSAHYAVNPSISCNSDFGTVGLVYAIDSSGANKDQSLVIFRLSHVASPYSYGPRDTLASTLMAGGAHPVPSITPAANGNFWVAWRNASLGGVVALVDTTGHIIAQKTVSAGILPETKQLSVASVLHPIAAFHGWTYNGPPAIDTCYLAFQAGLPGSSQIYFLKLTQRPGSPTIIDTTGEFCMSSALPWCENINPQMHVTQERALAAVWDGISNTGTGDNGAPARSHSSVLLRRSPFGQWINYTTYSGFNVPVVAGATDSLSTYPVYSGADWLTNPGDSSWQDLSRIGWTNPFEDRAHIAHYGVMAGKPIVPWDLTHLTTRSQDPVMAARTRMEGVLQPLMYRVPKHIDTLADGISLSTVDFPNGTEKDTATRVQTYIFHSPISGCQPKFVGRNTDGQLWNMDLTTQLLLWHSRRPYLWDSVTVPPSNGGVLSSTDGDSSLRTDNFRFMPGAVLEFGRYFRIGNYNVGDTAAAIAQLLSGTTDTLSMNFLLRNANTDAIVRPLEFAQLTSQGFSQSGSLADNGRASDTLNLTINDSVYISFETSHTSSSTAQLSRMESYDNSILDVIPMQVVRQDTIAKIALPPKAGQAEHTSSIEVRAYPNPLKQSTHVDLLNVEGLNTSVVLYDVLGNKISQPYTGTPTSYQLQLEVNAAGLRSGTYFLRVVAGNNITTKRLMIVK